jgi:hypothetical protein
LINFRDVIVFLWRVTAEETAEKLKIKLTFKEQIMLIIAKNQHALWCITAEESCYVKP